MAQWPPPAVYYCRIAVIISNLLHMKSFSSFYKIVFFRNFISRDGLTPINIEEETLSDATNEFEEGRFRHAFDSALLDIYSLMKGDSYRRFLSTLPFQGKDIEKEAKKDVEEPEEDVQEEEAEEEVDEGVEEDLGDDVEEEDTEENDAIEEEEEAENEAEEDCEEYAEEDLDEELEEED